MSKLTALAIALLVLLALAAERERRADMEKMAQWPVPPVRPEVTWPPAEPAPAPPPPKPYVPPDCYEMLPVHVPFHLEEMR